MTLALGTHPANRPGLPRRIFVAGWVLRQAVLPLIAAVLFDLSTGGSAWGWLLTSSICCTILATFMQRRAWALSSLPGEVAQAGTEAPPALPLASEILALLVTTALVFALALSSSLLGMLTGILFAAALLGRFAADAAIRFLRVGGMLQQFMIARIVVAAVLVVVSVTPAFLAARTGAGVASAALAVGTVIVVAGALTLWTRPGRGAR